MDKLKQISSKLNIKAIAGEFDRLLFIFLTVFMFTNYCIAQKNKTELLDSIATNLFESDQIYGGIFVAEGDTIIYNEAFGMSDKELGIKNAKNAVFPINSMSKSFTAVLILQLYEDGFLKLDDPVSQYLSGFKHPKANEITIHHLLSHRSGLQDYFLLQLKGEMGFDISMNEMLENIAETELEFQPGTAFSYNNTGYVLLAMIVEKQRKSSFKDALTKYIFDPLEMTKTFYSSTDKRVGSVKLYDQNGNPAQSNRYLIGDGGIFSTTTDLHKFLMSINTNTLLTKEIWELALTPHSFPKEAKRPFPTHFNPYGYGFSLTEWPYSNSKNGMTASHGGTGFGSSSYMSRFIDNNRIIIFWNNQYKKPVQPAIFAILAE